MVYCAALNCQNATSGAYKNSSVSFYGFPLQNPALLRQWIHNMGRDMDTPSKYQRLCSKHFEESAFERDPLKVRKIVFPSSQTLFVWIWDSLKRTELFGCRNR
uniref:THAP-type domain-containing protein n=1 Tax=Malurus cyaneus samueli TaxID=2593467 RepID=A0A8C5U7R5_9PASS